jgi:hypothetical protein
MTNGVYVIVDGGYHKLKATMSASRHGSGESFTQWREQLESVRKDIECREYSCRSNAATLAALIRIAAQLMLTFLAYCLVFLLFSFRYPERALPNFEDTSAHPR